MADTKITGLAALSAAAQATGDLVEVVDVSDTTMAATGTNKKMTLADFFTGSAGGVTATSTTAFSNKTLTDDSNVVHAEAVFDRVRNDSGVTLTRGTAVYASGYNAGLEVVLVDKAKADDPAKMPAIGIIDTDISHNANGHIITRGDVTAFNTSSFTVLDLLYVSTTAGEMTATRPTAFGTEVQQIAIVLRDHGSLGIISILGAGRANDVPNTINTDVSMADNTFSRVNLLDYGEITNAIGDTGGGAQDIDLELGNVVTATQTVGQTTYTFANPTASPEGCSFTFILTNGASNGGTIFPGSVTWVTPNGVTPTLQTSGIDILSFFKTDVGGTGWFGYASGRTRTLIFSSHAKLGTTGGWALGAANDLAYLATIPASQTNSTLIVPISGIEVGETITAFSIVGQIASAGNAVTIEGDLRVLTAAAADIADASVATVTTGSKTANYLVNDSTTGLTQAVASGEAYYVIIKGTTAGTTDAVMISVTVTLLRD